MQECGLPRPLLNPFVSMHFQTYRRSIGLTMLNFGLLKTSYPLKMCGAALFTPVGYDCVMLSSGANLAGRTPKKVESFRSQNPVKQSG